MCIYSCSIDIKGLDRWTIGKLIVPIEKGENTLNPPKIIITHIIFLQLNFLLMYGHHILDYFFFFKVYLISFRLHLINYFEKFNKH
jgi:hypothetical protein